jgi:hypothetical protein
MESGVGCFRAPGAVRQYHAYWSNSLDYVAGSGRIHARWELHVSRINGARVY